MTLRNLLAVIYGIKGYQLLGGPKWLNSAEYDIHAKCLSRTESGVTVRFMDDQKLRLQILLAERCQLKLHRETRQNSLYFLTVAKNGIRMAAASASQPKNSDAGVIIPWKLLVSEISQRLDQPIIDKTGLDGAYYVKLRYSNDDGRPTGIGVGRVDPADPGAASGPSIFTALRDQLGLVLHAGKGPVDVLVIDSAVQPSDN